MLKYQGAVLGGGWEGGGAAHLAQVCTTWNLDAYLRIVTQYAVAAPHNINSFFKII